MKSQGAKIERTLRFLAPPRRPIGFVDGIPALVFLHIDNLSVWAHEHHAGAGVIRFFGLRGLFGWRLLLALATKRK
jgi:hypothetical protein